MRGECSGCLGTRELLGGKLAVVPFGSAQGADSSCAGNVLDVWERVSCSGEISRCSLRLCSGNGLRLSGTCGAEALREHAPRSLGGAEGIRVASARFRSFCMPGKKPFAPVSRSCALGSRRSLNSGGRQRRRRADCRVGRLSVGGLSRSSRPIFWLSLYNRRQSWPNSRRFA